MRGSSRWHHGYTIAYDAAKSQWVQKNESGAVCTVWVDIVYVAKGLCEKAVRYPFNDPGEGVLRLPAGATATVRPYLS